MAWQRGQASQRTLDVAGRENVHHLVQHIADKLQRLIPAGAEDVVQHAVFAGHLIRAAGAAQLGIGRQSRLHVAGKVDLRNHLYAAGGRVGHHFAGFLLGIETADGNAVMPFPARHRTSGPPRAHFRQARILLDFQAPALVFRQMPMKCIELMEGQDIDDFLHGGNREEMAAAVQHESPVGILRIVQDLPARQGCALPFLAGGRKRLCQGLDAVEGPQGGSSRQHDLAGRHFKRVTLFFLERQQAFAQVFIQAEHQRVPASLQGDRPADIRPQEVGKGPGRLLQRVIGLDGDTAVQDKGFLRFGKGPQGGSHVPTACDDGFFLTGNKCEGT